MADNTQKEIPVEESQQPSPETTNAVSKRKEFTPELCASTINKLPQQLQAIKGYFAQPWDAFKKAFKDPHEADRVMAKEIDFAAQAMITNTFLIQVAQSNPLSLVNSIKNVALTGSTLNPVLKQGYLVPFKGSITFMSSYMGLVDLLYKTGTIRKIEAHAVYEGDEFEIRHGVQNGIFHKPDPWSKHDKTTLKGVYFYVEMADGTPLFDTLNIDEIEAIRKRAPSARNSSPWDTDYVEMAKKTAIRRAFKMLPKSGLSESQIQALEAATDYENHVEQYLKSDGAKATAKADKFNEDEEVVDYEEIQQ